jgi:HNH endonuclease
VSAWTETARFVEARAGQRCEYCRMHQALQGATFHVEHILPTSRGGTSELENLAWCCPSCNLSKSDRTHSTDPNDGSSSVLFNPRRNVWIEHFRWDGYPIVGQSSVGRATVAVLNLNQDRRILIRRAEELFDLFPP